MVLSPTIYHTLEPDSFKTAPCPDLALALFQNKSITEITGEIERCCPSPSIFDQALSYCLGVSSVQKSCPLNEKFTEYQITPIHLAAMKENLGAIEELASRDDVDLNAKDIYGFTPAHHLAMQGNAAGLHLLQSLGANTKLRTNDKATPSQLLRMSAPFRDSVQWENLQNTIQARHDFDPVCLGKGVSVTENAVGSPQVLTDLLWSFRSFIKNEADLNPRLNRYLLESHQEFLKTRPRLAIRPDQMENSCGLYALDPIQKGDIIGYYGGELHVMVNNKDLYGKNLESDEYVQEGDLTMDAKYFRTPSSMVNDSFPNAAFLPLAAEKNGVGGLPYQIALIALEPIQPGEEIFTNYGPYHDIKKEGHIEFRKEALDLYFSKKTLDQLIKDVKASFLLETKDNAFTLVEFVEKMSYVLTTPGSQELLKQEAGLDDRDLGRLNKLLRTAATIYSTST